MTLCEKCNNFKRGSRLHKFRCEIRPSNALRYNKCKDFEKLIKNG